jgi:tousled-like kinase
MGREINIMASTRHPNVVSFHGHFYLGEHSVGLVLELCCGGDLAQKLRKRGRLPEKEAKLILLQIIQGMTALRSRENAVIHYDLKPANILFDDEGRVKVTDFGLSKVVESDVTALELTSQGTGTYYYAAPETFKRGRTVLITPSVDTWSLGIIFYEMLYGQRPFGMAVSQQVFAAHNEALFAEELQFPGSVKVSDAARDFITICLERDPSRRPNLDQLMTTKYCSSD